MASLLIYRIYRPTEHALCAVSSLVIVDKMSQVKDNAVESLHYINKTQLFGNLLNTFAISRRPQAVGKY